jgi:hypothetical protein
VTWPDRPTRPAVGFVTTPGEAPERPVDPMIAGRPLLLFGTDTHDPGRVLRS